MPEPLLDTNVYIHALTNDRDSDECRRFLAALDVGQVSAVIDPLVIHELTYGLGRILRLNRAQVADHVRALLRSGGAIADRATLSPAIELWERTPGLGFVDAVLITRARREGRAVLTINRREFNRLGAETPNPLPSS